MISKLWLKMSYIFDPVQRAFNGNFWCCFQKKFQHFGQGKIVDLACGTGELKKYIEPEKYLGVDINISHNKFARKRFQNNKNIKFIRADITKFPIPKEYDTAFFISAAHHLSDGQIEILCHNIKKSGIKQLILVDGIPRGVFSDFLRWLDKILAGGEYFRDENQLVKILEKHFVIREYGTFSVDFSFYQYPYVVGKI